MLYERKIGWVLFSDKLKPETGEFYLRYDDSASNLTDMVKDNYDVSYWFDYGISFGEGCIYKMYQENDRTIIDLIGE